MSLLGNIGSKIGQVIADSKADRAENDAKIAEANKKAAANTQGSKSVFDEAKANDKKNARYDEGDSALENLAAEMTEDIEVAIAAAKYGTAAVKEGVTKVATKAEDIIYDTYSYKKEAGKIAGTAVKEVGKTAATMAGDVVRTVANLGSKFAEWVNSASDRSQEV